MKEDGSNNFRYFTHISVTILVSGFYTRVSNHMISVYSDFSFRHLGLVLQESKDISMPT